MAAGRERRRAAAAFFTACFVALLLSPAGTSAGAAVSNGYPLPWGRWPDHTRVEVGGDAPSAACARDLLKMTPQMYDATGKLLNSGLLDTIPNLASMGDYHECAGQFPFAQYCLVTGATHVTGTIAPELQPIVHLRAVNTTLPLVNWGVCIPRSCGRSPGDWLTVLQALPLRQCNLTASVTVTHAACQHDDPIGSSAAAVASVCVVALLACLVLAATLFDFYLAHRHHAATAIRSRGSASSSSSSSSSSVYDFGAQSIQDAHAGGEKEALLASGHGGRGDGGDGPDETQYSRTRLAVLAFSARRNFNKLTSLGTHRGHLGCLNGIRTLSMAWVLLGHNYLWSMSLPLTNEDALLRKKSEMSFQLVSNGFFSVDTFFWLSGFLVGLLTLRLLAKQHRASASTWGLYYLHRFLRITPLYMFVLMIYANLTPYFGSGPLWYSQQVPNACGSGWWANLLYIQNFYASFSDQCMSWAWYLANDMQFQWVAPIFLLAFHQGARLGLLVWNVAFWACTAVTLGLAIHYKFDANLFTNMTTGGGGGAAAHGPNYLDVIYQKPETRVGPFLIGLLFAYFYRCVTEDASSRLFRWRMPRWMLVFGWAVALFIFSASVFGTWSSLQGHPWGVAENSLYIALARPAWGLGLSWVAFVCLRGRTPLVDAFLSAKVWTVPARLTYAAYLIHPIVLTVFWGSFQAPAVFSDFHWVYFFMANLATTYFFAALASLLVEAPAMGLEKVIFRH